MCTNHESPSTLQLRLDECGILLKDVIAGLAQPWDTVASYCTFPNALPATGDHDHD